MRFLNIYYLSIFLNHQRPLLSRLIYLQNNLKIILTQQPWNYMKIFLFLLLIKLINLSMDKRMSNNLKKHHSLINYIIVYQGVRLVNLNINIVSLRELLISQIFSVLRTLKKTLQNNFVLIFLMKNYKMDLIFI